MKKGQLSVEFFLTFALIASFIVLLYIASNSQTQETKVFDAVVLAKSSVDSLANTANYVFLSGVGSVMRKEVFVSPGALCFYAEEYPVGSGTNRLYCTAPGTAGRVFSPPLYAKPVIYYPENTAAPDEDCIPVGGAVPPLTPGWYLFEISVLPAPAVGINFTCLRSLS